MPIRLFITLVLGAVLSLSILHSVAFAAEPIQLEEAAQTAEIEFGEAINFKLIASWDGPEPARVTVLFGLPDAPSRIFENVAPQVGGGELTAGHRWEVASALVPGAEIEYHWRITDADGLIFATAPSRIMYQDSSLPWKRIGEEVVEIMWYEGNDEFGQMALDAATGALARIRDNFDVDLVRPTRIVLYADIDMMHSALGGGTSPWAAGQAIIPFNTIVLHAPVSTPELDILIAHELAHIVIGQITENPFSSPPAWIHEGIATYIESAGDPRFDYDGIVERAVRNGSLISLRGLTSTFPASNTRAILAYAESNSLIRFVIDKYGKESVRGLLDAYREGVTDDEAVQRTLNVSFAELEALWMDHIDPSRQPAVNPEASTPQSPQVTNTPTPTPLPTPTAIAALEVSPTPTSVPVESRTSTPASQAAAPTPTSISEQFTSAPTPEQAEMTPTIPGPAIVSTDSQIPPPTSVVRNVAIGSVVVIIILIGFVVHQVLSSRSRR